jgi:hypothetical protein
MIAAESSRIVPLVGDVDLGASVRLSQTPESQKSYFGRGLQEVEQNNPRFFTASACPSFETVVLSLSLLAKTTNFNTMEDSGLSMSNPPELASLVSYLNQNTLPTSYTMQQVITIASTEQTIQESVTGAVYNLREWSFWLDTALRAPKLCKLRGCVFAILRRRLDNMTPSDSRVAYTWTVNSHLTRNGKHGAPLAVIALEKVLDIAVRDCEKILSIEIVRAKIPKRPARAEMLKEQSARYGWPMPEMVNVFTRNKGILAALDDHCRDNAPVHRSVRPSAKSVKGTAGARG